jgi:shikimate kinase
MLIFLIGFMGSGKTTTGRKLARRLGFEFADLDILIEEHEGMEITEIFAHKGEEYFRNVETKVLDSLLGLSRLVVACGGGTPCFHDNMQKMKSSGTTVYLKVSAEVLAVRLSRSPSVRPLVAGKDGDELNSHIRKLLAGREGWYRQADLVFDADNFDIEHLLEKIKSRIKETD